MANHTPLARILCLSLHESSSLLYESLMSRKIALEVIEGPQQGQTFTFDSHRTFIVGRAQCAHFRLPKDDRYISRVHFMIECNPPLCRVADLGSRNGTEVNGKRVEAANLQDGDHIQAGQTIFRVSMGLSTSRGNDPTVEKARDHRPAGARSPDAIAETADRQPEDRIVATGAGGRGLEETGGMLPCIDGLKLVRELGRGGMGVVYLAQRLDDETEVAVKTILPAVSGSELQIARFLREARVLERLHHPGIVRFYEMGRTGEQLYFVMEYVHGSDAASEVKKHERPPIRPVVEIICQTLEALHYAHEQGYVHRDVKPSNLLLTREGGRTICKLADFGLARAYNRSPLSGLTMIGAISGTLAYIPPEQITDCHHTTPAADQYSAAATAYHMLCRQHLFDFDDLSNERRISKILFDAPVPAKARRSDIPDELSWVIDRALEKRPEKRFRNILAFREALLPFA
jgi:serine/threonine-protein kinase